MNQCVLANGVLANIGTESDMLEAIREYMGYEFAGVARYFLSERIEEERHKRFLEVHKEAKRIMDECLKYQKQILSDIREEAEKVVSLLDKKRLNREKMMESIDEILNKADDEFDVQSEDLDWGIYDSIWED